MTLAFVIMRHRYHDRTYCGFYLNGQRFGGYPGWSVRTG